MLTGPWLHNKPEARLELEPRPPRHPPLPSPASLTSLTESHVPASCSSRTRLATDMTPWPSCSQGPVKGSGSPAPRAVTLFRKCTMASSAAGPRGAASFARTLSRIPRKLEASASDRCPWASERGSGRSCGQSSHLRQVWLLGGISQGSHLGPARVFLVGPCQTYHKPPALKGSQ